MPTYITDYPIQGNSEHKVIEIELLAYDRNKYATVRHGDVIEEIKAGYIFKLLKDGQRKSLKNKDLLSLPRELGGKIPTRKQLYAELKRDRKTKVIYSFLLSKPNGFKLSDLKASTVKDIRRLLDNYINKEEAFAVGNVYKDIYSKRSIISTVINLM